MSDDRGGVWDTLLIILSEFDGWFCVLSGFFDETYKQQGLHLTGVGGFIFRKEDLSALQLELSGIDCAEYSASQLRQWGRSDVLAQLAKTIARHKGIGFACTVTDEEWQKLSPKNKDWLGTSYSACVFEIIDLVSLYLKKAGLPDQVFYTIEAGADGQKHAQSFLRMIENQPRVRQSYRVRGSTFLHQDGKEGLLLRAADLFINEWQRNYREMEIDPEGGWSEIIKLLLPYPESPPIYYRELGVSGLRSQCVARTLHSLIEC